MLRRGTENEHPCSACQAHAPAKKGLQEFPDGHSYFVTGTCTSETSPLFEKPIAGAHTATTNAVHHRVIPVVERMQCFRPKRI